MRRVKAVDGLTSFLMESSSGFRNHAVGNDVRGCGGGGGAKTGVARKTTARWRSDFMSVSANGGRGKGQEFGPLARGQRLEKAYDRWFLVQKRGAAGRGRHAPGLYKVIGDFEALNGRCVARQRGRGVCAGGPVCPGGGS